MRSANEVTATLCMDPIFTVIMLGIDRFCAQLQSNKVSVYSKTGKCLQMQAIMTDEEFGQLEFYPDFSI